MAEGMRTHLVLDPAGEDAPDQIRREFPVGEKAAQTTFDARRAIHRILHGADDRLLVIIGPCSIHDPNAALEVVLKTCASLNDDDCAMLAARQFDYCRCNGLRRG